MTTTIHILKWSAIWLCGLLATLLVAPFVFLLDNPDAEA